MSKTEGWVKFGAAIGIGVAIGAIGYYAYTKSKTTGYSPYVNKNIAPALLHVNQGQAYSPQATPYTINAPNIYNSPMTRRAPIDQIHQTPYKPINPPQLGFNPGQVNYYSPLALPFEEGHANTYYSPFSYSTKFGAGNPKLTGGPEWTSGGDNEWTRGRRCPGGCRG